MGELHKNHRCQTPTRRKFLKDTTLATAGLATGGLFSMGTSCSSSSQKSSSESSSSKKQKQDPPTQKNSRSPQKTAVTPTSLGPLVVTRADQNAFGKTGHNDARVKALVDRSVTALVGVKSPAEAYRALFQPTDTVAIKLNCLAGPGMSSSKSVVDAIVLGLRSIGIPFQNILLFERSTKEMTKVGFKSNIYNTSGPKCMGNDETGFQKDLLFSGEIGSLFTNAIGARTTAVINVPVLKDHDLSGVGCAMKNMYGVIHNPNRYHDNNCSPYVADLNAHPLIKDKLRLTVADALTAQYHGGPARVLTHQWKPGKILAATDPVALDRVAQKLIEEQRAAHGLASLAESKRPPKWLALAGKKGLGEADMGKIVLDEG